jgi:DNA polymerase-3 subunit epsilon
MSSRRFVICDIEATGLGEDKEIIEIALITLEDNKVVDVYQSLVNPLTPVSTFIQHFTSISLRDLEQAPKFYDIAETVKTRLEGNVFVSHNTDFDYLLLKKKYEEMGQELGLKTFCTLKIAQEEIPGLKSYTLDALCSFFRIKNHERHRAIGDAKATLELFQELRHLRHHERPKIMFHEHHEKMMKDIPQKAGLLHFKNTVGKVIRMEATFNMEKKARELLEVKRENRELLEQTEALVGEVTGSALIAEFRKLLFYPIKAHWLISVEINPNGEKFFKIKPRKQGNNGEWYFEEFLDAKKELQRLVRSLEDEKFAYREGKKSKEEVFKHNMKIDQLVKEAHFPNPHLILVGEGRSLGEKSLVLIRNHHVAGYGYTDATEEEIFADPDKFLTRRYVSNLGVDLAALRYLKVLKNLRAKTEAWRSLAAPLRE